jgi:hypothetical protein
MKALIAQFDEYRATSEFIFNSEASKLQDELRWQAQRYEQDILYVIQVKDKFYTDMMVAKDAKIMSLIEGSDLQSLIQRSEMVFQSMWPYFLGIGITQKITSKRNRNDQIGSRDGTEKCYFFTTTTKHVS